MQWLISQFLQQQFTRCHYRRNRCFKFVNQRPGKFNPLFYFRFQCLSQRPFFIVKLLQFIFRPSAFGNISSYSQDASDTPLLIPECGHYRLNPDRGTVLAFHLKLQHPRPGQVFCFLVFSGPFFGKNVHRVFEGGRGKNLVQ
ncbi:hypothetical protein ES703_105542 [subsurface metagenome]